MMIDGIMIMSGFVSKVINDCGDILKSKIRSADKKRRFMEQNIETRIYQVTIDAINVFTFGTYKDKDILYDAAERILKGFKDGKGNTEVVIIGLKMLDPQITDGICEGFFQILRHEICKDENDILYKEIVMIGQEQMDDGIHEGMKRSDQNHRETHEQLDKVMKILNHKEVQEVERNSVIHVENRAEEYADKWNENVFLNDFDEEDESDGVNIKLRDIYKEECLPHYIWKENTRPSEKTLRDFLKKYIIDNQDRKMLLILGQPGIGKSTLITWIMVNLVEKKDEIFVYQFARDLKNNDWQGTDILDAIFKTLRLREEELENKVLILDGFDEIRISGDRERILNELSREVKEKRSLGTFSLIIFCRENYVNRSCLSVKNYITLQAWDKEQIKSFCEIYKKESAGKNTENQVCKTAKIKINKILEKKEIFGIPLILYMVLALNVDVEKSSSIVDIYDQIFSLKSGGIYDRCYDAEHRINEPVIKKYIHQTSQRIAFWIFENNAVEAFITQEKFEEICMNEMIELRAKVERKELSPIDFGSARANMGYKNEGIQSDEIQSDEIQSDTLIGNFFKIKHCEGEEAQELHFIHRSIYEYFVVVYFFESLCDLTSEKEIAWKLGEFLKDGHLSEQILEFIKYKFDKMKECNLPDSIKEIFNIMLRDGMTYHMAHHTKEPVLNILDREMNIFSNMLEIVHLWEPILGKTDDKIEYYLRYNHFTGLNLNGANLNGANLAGANLSGVNLREADLSGASLTEVNLREANLNGTNLNGANLREANLSGAGLRGAELSGTDLRVANLRGADLRGANLIEADLSGTDLNGADLCGANLIGTNLSGAYLIGAYLNGIYLDKIYLGKTVFDAKQVDILHKKCELSNSMVYIPETNEIITYEQYYTQKRKW